MAWHLGQEEPKAKGYQVCAPRKGGERCTLRLVRAVEESNQHPGGRLYLFAYFCGCGGREAFVAGEAKWRPEALGLDAACGRSTKRRSSPACGKSGGARAPEDGDPGGWGRKRSRASGRGGGRENLGEHFADFFRFFWGGGFYAIPGISR